MPPGAARAAILARVSRFFFAALLVAASPFAQSAETVPAFDVAYRAWELVTAVARHHRDPSIAGECGRTFQPFVVPALRRQTKQEQAAAAIACQAQARALCASDRVPRTADFGKKCEEFRQ